METIGRFRAVSEDSNSIMSTPLFVESFHRRTERVSGYFIQCMRNSKYSSTFLCIDQPDAKSETSLKFLPRPVKIEASSNELGLLLCADQDLYRSCRVPPRYYVCKPSTKQWQLLPNPKTKYFTLSFAMTVLRTDPLYYKIVRLSQPKPRNNSDEYKFKRLQVEVFDSKSWVWKQLDDVKLPYGVFLNNAPAVAACGALHWLTTDDRVLAFDADKETCNTFMLPESFHGNKRKYRFVEVMEYKGSLVAMGIRKGCEDESLEVWAMEDYDRKSWTRGRYFNTQEIKCPEEFVCPIGFYDDETAVFKGFWGLILHKFKDRANNVGRLKSNYVEPREVFFYQSDFEPCDLMARK